MIPLQNFESFVWISVLNLKNQLDTSLQWFPLYQLCSPNSSLQMVSCKFASTSFHYCSSVVICFLISFISVFNCTKTHKPRIVLKEQGLSAALWTTILDPVPLTICTNEECNFYIWIQILLILDFCKYFYFAIALTTSLSTAIINSFNKFYSVLIVFNRFLVKVFTFPVDVLYFNPFATLKLDNGSPLKLMRIAFYFNVKALFVLEILIFFSRRFGCIEKWVW